MSYMKRFIEWLEYDKNISIDQFNDMCFLQREKLMREHQKARGVL